MSHDDHNLPNNMKQLKAMIAERDAAYGKALAERDQTIVQHTTTITQHTEVITQHVATITQHTEVITQHETVIAAQHATIEKQLKKLEGLQRQVAQLLRRQYGPQKERIDPSQLTLFTAEELEQLAAELQQGIVDSVPTDDGSDGGGSDEDTSANAAAASTTENAGDAAPDSKPKRNGHGRRPLPANLPRETVVYELTEEERTCPCCGKLRKVIGTEVSEQLEFIPAHLKVIEHHRTKYACDACEEHVSIAPKPPQPIEKGLPGPGLLAHTVLSKYGDYLPLYRQEDILSRCGIILRRSTLGGWIASAADLLKPLYDLMCARVCSSHVIHTDDTGIKMLEEIQCRNCKFWTYVGDEQNPYAVYEFSLTREGKEPTRFLENFTGYLQADAFVGYDQVFSKGQIIEVACMAHCRRYWWEAKDTDSRRAHEALSYISRLYELEVQFETASLNGNALRDARQKHATPILNAFEAWLKKEYLIVLPKAKIAGAFTYTMNQWQALCRYTEDGCLDIDNNTAERMVKLPAIGRKNWLFVGSEAGGHRAAILLSIIASAKHCGVEPWAWLNAVLRELPIRTASVINEGRSIDNEPPDIRDLLPDAWLKNHPEHRWQIDDIRQEERKQSRQQKILKRRTQGR